MIQQPTQPDPIDALLDKIAREADADELRYASFIQRVMARIVDTAVVLMIAYGLGLIFLRFVRNNNDYNVDYISKSIQQALPALALMIWVLLYSPIMESTGGTLGKRLVGIKLVDLSSNELPVFRMCMARTWVYMIFVVLAGIPAVLSCLAYFVSDHKQTGMIR